MSFTRWAPVVIALLYAYAIAVGLGSLLWPLGRDQGIFAWAGDVVLGGGAPYADAWDVKGVATYYTFALSQWLFGRTLWGIRVLDLAFLALTCACLFRLLRRRTGAFVAHVGVVFFALFHLARGYWSTAQPDAWGTMLVVMSLTLVMKPHGVGRRDRIAAGALIGLAALYKMLFASFLLPLMVYECLDPDGRRAIEWDRVWSLLVGCVGVMGVSLAVLFAQGAVDEFVEIQFGFNREVHSQAFAWTAAMSAKRFSGFFGLFWWALPVAAVGLFGLWRRERRLAQVLMLQFLVAMACIAVQNKYYGYHWHPLRMCLLLFFAFGISQLLLWSEALGRPRASEESLDSERKWVATSLRVVVVAALVGILVFFGPALNRTGWSALVTRTTPVEDYYKSYRSAFNWSFKFSTNLRVVNYIAAHTGAGDSLLIWGFEPMINFLTGRPSPTRFGYNYPLVAKPEATFSKAYRREFVDALRTTPPTYIVVGIGDQNSLLKKSSRKFLDEFDEFLALLERDYVLETRVGSFELWRHTPRPTS